MACVKSCIPCVAPGEPAVVNTLVVPALSRSKQGGQEFKASLGELETSLGYMRSFVK